ncbi:Fe-Mn family superoxide dismutase [Pseudenhygromyxa sp. WMMC2535]|uniref:Fe-Mn family superoxide dismutase n=1 Tax=Pseudenhygromyxa sp. WMMC2535 TaxID=2712867 RepID=UPI001C3D12B8|nr:Fe-Mn family superoxide dismutase [Pseudenhygromyxa sp. WMMC2535]
MLAQRLCVHLIAVARARARLLGLAGADPAAPGSESQHEGGASTSDHGESIGQRGLGDQHGHRAPLGASRGDDYRNDRAAFIAAVIDNLANWDFVASQL